MRTAYVLLGYFLGRVLPHSQDYFWYLGIFIFWGIYVFICEYPNIKNFFRGKGEDKK